MHKRKLLSMLTMAALILAGCDTVSSSLSSSDVSSSTVPSSSLTDSSSSSKTEDSSSSSPIEVIEHQSAFVRDLPEGSVVRNYNDKFDTMLDDFSAQTLAGTNSNGIQHSVNSLKVLVDNEATPFPSTTDASIYKMATGNYEIQKYDGIGFKLRVVSGKISYSNLVLGLRGDDAYKVYELGLADCVNPDNETLPTLSNEFVDVVVSPNLSIEDDQTSYELAAGGSANVAVLSKILGFHFMAKGEVSAVIEISEVYLMLASEKTVLDSFNRTAVNKADDTCWWRDSTGFIVSKNIELKDGASYTIASNEAIAKETNVVISVCGDTSTTSIAPVYADGAKESIAWNLLKNPNGEAIPNAVNGAFHPIVINLEASGITATGLVGIKVTSTSDVFVNTVFASSLKEKEALVEYPKIDTANAVVFDSFTRTQAHVDATYDAAAANEKVTNAGLYYSIAYHNDQFTSVDGDCLILTGGEYDYVQVTEGSSHAWAGQKYLVFVMKVEEGGSLSDFRINSNTSGVSYATAWKAGPDLNSIPADMSTYPYALENGFAYYIIDLAETGITAKDAMDIYYSGSKDLLIDSIFFADTWQAVTPIGAGGVAALTGGYVYVYGGYIAANTSKIKMVIKGDGTANLDTFRMEYNGSTVWANAALVMTTENGTVVDAKDVLPTEDTVYYVDLVASGYDTSKAENVHFHFDGAGASGTITIVSAYALTAGPFVAKYGDGGTVTIEGGYQYLYGGYCDGSCDTIQFTLKGDGTINLASFRLEYNGTTVWAKDTLVVTVDGEAVDVSKALPTTETVYTIDLAASGFTTGVAEHMHFHFGDSDVNGTIVIGTVNGVATSIPYSAVIGQYVEYVAPQE